MLYTLVKEDDEFCNRYQPCWSPLSRRIMSAEKNSTNKIRQGKKTSASCFACFSSSADSDSGFPEESKPGAGSKRKLSSCFSWPRCRNTKKKRKGNAALLNAPTPPSTDLNAVEGRSPLAQVREIYLSALVSFRLEWTWNRSASYPNYCRQVPKPFHESWVILEFLWTVRS